MFNTILLNICLLATLVSNPVKLEVVIRNIQVGKGSIVVKLYDTEEDLFRKPVKTETIKASSHTLDFSFDIPEGTYALAVYQDINENKVLDKGIFSIPKEPYGLSNNYRPRFRRQHLMIVSLI